MNHFLWFTSSIRGLKKCVFFNSLQEIFYFKLLYEWLINFELPSKNNNSRKCFNTATWRNWVFATNSNFRILISLIIDGVKLLIFQNYIIWFTWIYSWKYLKSKTLCCKDIAIKKSEFMTKTFFVPFHLPAREFYLSP